METHVLFTLLGATGELGTLAGCFISSPVAPLAPLSSIPRIRPDRSPLLPFSWLLRRGTTSASLIRRPLRPPESANAFNEAFGFASRVIFCSPDR